jgi:phosphopantothenoylcysteine decarboxylase/phosphopantothenate--cysteine ligase
MNNDLNVDIISNELSGKNVAFCVTGLIAAIESPKIIRQLRRFGANVNVYMTDAAKNFITEMSLEWASGNRVLSEMTGLSEHICFEDIVLVAPCTSNTLYKIKNNISDNLDVITRNPPL